MLCVQVKETLESAAAEKAGALEEQKASLAAAGKIATETALQEQAVAHKSNMENAKREWEDEK
jgi:hypothetical protein